MENDDNTTKNAIEERLNRIKNQMNSDQMKNMDDEELPNDAADQSSKSLDLNKLKEKVKIDNAPELKGVKEIDKNIQQKKNF